MRLQATSGSSESQKNILFLAQCFWSPLNILERIPAKHEEHCYAIFVPQPEVQRKVK
jgi:hypothetical protein